MKVLNSAKKLITNPHIYTALIAAAIILGSAWFLKGPDNNDIMMIIITSVASAQIIISNSLAKKKPLSCKK